MTGRDKMEKIQEKQLSSGNSVGLGQPVGKKQLLQPLEEAKGSSDYSGVGLLLRAERQRRQISLSEVSDKLRIQRDHLAALEEGRTTELPGATYAAGFLRTYSDYLGLDGEGIVQQYKREGTLMTGEQRLIFLEPLEEARRPGLSLALISLVVAGVIYSSWIFLERQDQLHVETVSEPPRRLLTNNGGVETLGNEATRVFQSPDVENLRDRYIETNMGPVPDVSSNRRERKDPIIEQNNSPKLKSENVSEKFKTNFKAGEGEQAAAADVAGLVASNLNDPVNTSSELFANNEIKNLEDIAEKPPTLTDLKKPQLALTKRMKFSPNFPNEKAKKVHFGLIMPTDQSAVTPLTVSLDSNAPARPISNNTSEAFFSATNGESSRVGAAEMVRYRPQAYGLPERKARVVLLARTETWVQVQGTNEELLLTRMLRPGDSYHAPDGSDLILMTGNAGAIEVVIDGDLLGVLGPSGQVRRNIRLNVDNLRGHFGLPVIGNQ